MRIWDAVPQLGAGPGQLGQHKDTALLQGPLTLFQRGWETEHDSRDKQPSSCLQNVGKGQLEKFICQVVFQGYQGKKSGNTVRFYYTTNAQPEREVGGP